MVEKKLKQEKNEEEEERNVYKVIHGRFNYGGNSKVYGLFFILLNDGPTLTVEKLDLAISNQKNIDDIGLKISSKLFVEALNEAKGSEVYQSQKLGMNLKNSLNTNDLKAIKRAIEDNELEKLSQVFKEKLEDKFQEQTRVKTEFSTLVEEEVKSIYPSLFTEEEAEDEADSSKEQEESKKDSQKKEAEEAKITLKCSPVISPASGVKAESLNVGDTVSVKITDGSETAKRYKSELHGDKGFVTGEIDDLLFNKESDRYSISMNLKDNIYGELVVGPQVKLAVSDSAKKADDITEINQEDSNYNKKLILLFGLVGAALILLIIMIGFYLT